MNNKETNEDLNKMALKDAHSFDNVPGLLSNLNFIEN